MFNVKKNFTKKKKLNYHQILNYKDSFRQLQSCIHIITFIFSQKVFTRFHTK